MKSWEALDAVEQDPDKVSGRWVFRGTRVPVAALFENLRDGATIEQFLEWFPGVNRSQVEAVLNHEVISLTDGHS
ncbi:DUF433 domain-containing protein [Catalinimonas niigatensis]|uniref:DUF433 domain-containing protein n=1 Tax=Catalinimonas niigatensis TaxID=1397264 RepID=UPI0026654D16|nr:DUF433 domain-containing protein [Catalinimonas niigatensis]WPP51483.1 DUF433 domain-containing protein [Catalinimonas niigatensis]